MAAKPKLTLDALDDLLKKAEVTYKKLQDVEGRLEVLNKKSISLEISQDTVKSLKALADLTDAFRGLTDVFKVLSNVKAGSVKTFTDNVNELVKTFENAKKLVSDEPDGSVLKRVASGVKDLIGILEYVTDSENSGKFSEESLKKAQESVAQLVKLAISATALTKDVTNFDDVKKAADGLSDLSKVLGKFSKTKTNKQAISDISDTLLSLAKASESAGAFAATFTSLTGLMKVVTTLTSILPGGKELDKLASTFKKMGDAFNNINSSLGARGGFAAAFASIIRIGVMFPALMAALTLIFKNIAFLVQIIPGQDSYIKLVGGIRSLSLAFVDINNSLGGKSGGGFASTFASIARIGVIFPLMTTALTVVFKGLALITALIPGQAAFSRFTQSIRNLGVAFSDIDKSLGQGNGFFGSLTSIVRIGVIFPLLTTALTVVFKGLALITAWIPGQDSFERFTQSVRNLGVTFSEVDKALGQGKGFAGTLMSIVRIGVIFPLLVTQLSIIFRSVAAILAALPGNDSFYRMTEAFLNLGNALQKITTSTKAFNIADLIKFKINMMVVGNVLKSLTQSFVKSETLEPFVHLAEGMAKVGYASGQFTSAAKEVNIGSLLKIVLLLKVLGGAMKGLGKGITQAEANTIKTIGEAMEAVGISVRKISTSMAETRDFDFGALKSYHKLMSELKSVTKTLSKFSNKVNPAGMQAIADMVTGVGKILGALSTLQKNNPNAGSRDDHTFDLIGKQFNTLKGLLNTLKGIRANSLTGIVSALSSLGTLITALSKTTLSKEKADQIKVTVKAVGEAIRELDFGFFSGRKIKGLDAIAKSFSALNQLKVNGNTVKEISDLMSALKEFDTSSINLQGFDVVMERLVRGLQKVADLKIDGDDLARVEKNLDLLAKEVKIAKEAEAAQNGTARATKSAWSNFKGMSDAVEEGSVNALAKMKLVELAFKGIGWGIKELNPIALFMKVYRAVDFVSGAVSKVIGFVRNVGQAVTNAIQSVQTLGTNLKDFGNNLTQALGVGVLIGSSAFSAATDFDALSTQLQVFGKLTDDQLVSAQAFANEIGIKYPLSANEAMDAMLSLMKAGQDLGNIQKILPNAADLASLTDSKDINATTQLLISSSSLFKQFTADTVAGYDNISVAANLFANAADVSQATVEGLQESFANLGPIASQYGLSLSDAASMLGVLSNAQLDGAEAGTAIKSMLTNLTTTAAQKELQKLNVKLMDSDGNFRNFDDILKDINTSMSESITYKTAKFPGVTKENETQVKQVTAALAAAQKGLFLWQNQIASGSGDPEKAAKKVEEYQRQITAAQSALTGLTGSQEAATYITGEVSRSALQNATSLKNLFGAYGQVAGGILLSNDGFAAMQALIEGGGTAADRAAALLNNFNGDVEQLTGSVETFNTKAMLPLIAKIFRPFVKVARLVVDSLLQMDSGVLEFITTVIAFGSIAATLIGTLSVIAGTVISVGASFMSFIWAASNIFTVVGVLVGGLAGLTVGLVALAGAALAISGALIGVTAIFEAFRRIMEENLGGARDAWDKLVVSISEGAQSVIHFFQSLGNMIGAVLGGSGADGLTTVGKRLAAFFGGLANNPTLQKAKTMLDGFSEIFDVFTGALTLDQRAEAAFSQTLNSMQTIPTELAQRGISIKDAATNASDAIRAGFDKMAAGLIDNPILQRVFGKEALADVDVQKYISSFLFYASAIRSAVSGIIGSFGTFLDNIGRVGFGKALTQLTESLDEGIRGLSVTILSAIQELFGVDLTEAINVLDTNNLGDSLVILLQKALAGVKDSLLKNRKSVAAILKTALGALFMPLKSIKFISDVLGLDGLSSIIDGVQNTISSIFGGLIETIFNLMEGQDLGLALENAFGPSIRPLLNFAKSIGRLVDTIVKGVSRLFGGLTKSIGAAPDFGAILGQILDSFTSFIDKFTNGVLTPLLAGDFMGALSGFFDLLGLDLLSSVANSLKNGDVTGAISTLANALWGVVKSALQLVPTLITGIGEMLGSPLLVKIGQDMQTGDWGGAVSTLATGIGTVVMNAIRSVPSLLVNLGTDLNSPLLVKIGESLSTGDWSAAIGAIGAGLVTIVTDAIKSVPGLITNLGEILNSPLLTKIGNDLAVGDWVGVIDSVAQTVKQIITDALGKVPELLGSIADLLDLTWLEDFSLSLQTSLAFQWFTDAIGRLASFALETVSAGVKGISDAITAMTISPTTSFAVIGVLGAVVLFAAKGAIISSLSTALTALGTSLSTLGGLAAKVAGIAAVILILKNVLENLGTLLSGDIWTSVGGILIGIVEDVTNLTGIDTLLKEKFGFDLDFDALRTTWGQLGVVIESVLTDAADRAMKAVQNILDGLALEALRTAARIAVAGGLATEGFGKQLYQIDDALTKLKDSLTTGNFGFTTMSQDALSQIAAVWADPANRDFVATQLRTAFGQIFNTFQRTDFRTLLGGTEEQKKFASDVFTTLIASGGFTEGALFAGQQYGPEVMKELLTNLLKFNPAALDGLDTTTVLNEFMRQAVSGQTGAGTVLEVAAQLKLAGVLTREQYDQFVKDMQAKFAGFQAEGADGGRPTDVPLPVTVTPQPKVTPFTPGAINAAIQGAMPTTAQQAVPVDVPMDATPKVTPLTPETINTAMQGALPTDGAGNTTGVEVPITPTFAAPTDTAGVEALGSALKTALDNLKTLGVELNNFTSQSPAQVTKLNSLSLSVMWLGTSSSIAFSIFLTNVNSVGAAFVTFADITVLPRINNIIARLWALLLTTQLVTAGMITAITIDAKKDPWAIWSKHVTDELDKVIRKVDGLNKTMDDLLVKIRNLLTLAPQVPTDFAGGGGGGGGRTPTGMAEGGKVGAGIYQILEDNIPEVLQQDGKSWLLSPGAGEVTALKNVPRLGLDQYRSVSSDQMDVPRNVGAGQVSNTYVNINEGDIVVNVPAAAGMTSQEAITLVRQSIREELSNRNQTLQSRLRTGHR